MATTWPLAHEADASSLLDHEEARAVAGGLQVDGPVEGRDEELGLERRAGPRPGRPSRPPDEGVGTGSGAVGSLDPPQAASAGQAAGRAAVDRDPAASAERAHLGPTHGLGQDPELPHREVGEVPEEGGRVLLVDVVADALEDPAQDEEAGRRPERR